MTCASSWCQNRATHEVRRRWFCRTCYPKWWSHYRVLDRILSIPVRRD